MTRKNAKRNKKEEDVLNEEDEVETDDETTDIEEEP